MLGLMGRRIEEEVEKEKVREDFRRNKTLS